MKFTYYKLVIITLIFVCSMDFAFSRRLRLRKRKEGPKDFITLQPTGENSHYFDIHDYAQTHKDILLDISLKIFNAENLIGEYSEGKIPEKDLINIIKKISKGYHGDEDLVFYHKALHAADAMQTIYTYFRYIEGGKATELQKMKLLGMEAPKLVVLNDDSPKLNIKSTEKIAIYFALAGHDYGHMGIENRCYQILHDEYNERYPFDETSDKKEFSLEKFHAEQVLKILEEAGFFKNMKKMGERHSYYLKQLIKAAIERTDGRYPHVTNLGERFTKGFKPEGLSENDRIDLFAFLVHAADVSNPSKHYGIYILWAEKVLMEFMRQGLIETKGTKSKTFLKLFNEKLKDKNGEFILNDKGEKIPKYRNNTFPTEKQNVMKRQQGFIFYLDKIEKILPTMENIFPSLGYFTQLARYNSELLVINKDSSKTERNDLQLIDEHQLEAKNYDEVPTLDKILENIKAKQ